MGFPTAQMALDVVLLWVPRLAQDVLRSRAVLKVTTSKRHFAGGSLWGPVQQKPSADDSTVAVADGWPSAKAMREADVIVFYSNNPGWNDSKALELDEFQRRGGGLVYLHFAVDGHEATQALSDRIGLAWRGGKAKFRHGMLDLELSESSPITRGLSQLSIHDESYWQLSGDPTSINVLATSIEDGKPQPVIWTRENGSGRVFVSIPGHYTWTFDDPLFRVLILRGICWAAHAPEDRLTPLAAIGARIIETPAVSSNTATGL